MYISEHKTNLTYDLQALLINRHEHNLYLSIDISQILIINGYKQILLTNRRKTNLIYHQTLDKPYLSIDINTKFTYQQT